MQGFPPPADKQVNRGNAMTMPYMRWTFRHTRERAPTAGLRHSDTPLPLPEGTALDLDKVTFRVGRERLAGFFIEEGLLDPRAKLARYVPESAGTPFGEATLQQNLDMEVAVAWAIRKVADVRWSELVSPE